MPSKIPYDVYRTKSGTASGEAWWRVGDMCRLTGPDDRTASDPYEYNRNCTSCILGHAHSKAFHKQNLDRYLLRR